MPSTGIEAFNRSTHTAGTWVSVVAEEIGTDDHGFALRALRAWLHVLRDALGVNASAGVAAQLPELLRGAYYEGWEPSAVPLRYGPDEYRLRLAHQTGVPVDEVAALSAAVYRAMHDCLAPGQLAAVLDGLPYRVRALLRGRDPARPLNLSPAGAA